MIKWFSSSSCLEFCDHFTHTFWTQATEFSFFMCIEDVENVTHLAVYLVARVSTLDIRYFSFCSQMSCIGWYKQQRIFIQIFILQRKMYYLSENELLIDYLFAFCSIKLSIPENLMLCWMVELLSIAEKLQECCIIHGDIKPDNFILRTL
jgi:serine/threonine protein kinase